MIRYRMQNYYYQSFRVYQVLNESINTRYLYEYTELAMRTAAILSVLSCEHCIRRVYAGELPDKKDSQGFTGLHTFFKNAGDILLVVCSAMGTSGGTGGLPGTLSSSSS